MKAPSSPRGVPQKVKPSPSPSTPSSTKPLQLSSSPLHDSMPAGTQPPAGAMQRPSTQRRPIGHGSGAPGA